MAHKRVCRGRTLWQRAWLSLWAKAACATLTVCLAGKRGWPKLLTFPERRKQGGRMLAACTWRPPLPWSHRGRGTVEDSCRTGLSRVLGLAVGGKGSSASLTQGCCVCVLSLGLGLSVPLSTPLVLGSRDCWSKVGVRPRSGRCSYSCEKPPPPPHLQPLSVHLREHVLSI